MCSATVDGGSQVDARLSTGIPEGVQEPAIQPMGGPGLLPAFKRQADRARRALLGAKATRPSASAIGHLHDAAQTARGNLATAKKEERNLRTSPPTSERRRGTQRQLDRIGQLGAHAAEATNGGWRNLGERREIGRIHIRRSGRNESAFATAPKRRKKKAHQPAPPQTQKRLG